MKFSELLDMFDCVEVNPEDKFAAEYRDERLNCQDIDSLMFQRTPKDNDRPELERLYKRLPKDENGNVLSMIFYAFVVVGENKDKNSRRSVLVNVVDEFGNLVASHLNEFAGIFKDYRGELVEFEARPNKYKNEDKYSLFIIPDSVRVINSHHVRQCFSPWTLIGYPSKQIKVQECINYYLTKGNRYHKELYYESERLLDYISEKMFGIRGMLFPVIMDMCLLRDNGISYYDEIEKNLKHINIICTVIIDYILASKPNSYLGTYQLISYIILNYLGLNLNNPRDLKYSKYLSTTIESFNVKSEHVAYHIFNIFKGCGGSNKIVESIPEDFKTNPEKIVNDSRIYFANRILRDVPEETIKYLVNLKGLN